MNVNNIFHAAIVTTKGTIKSTNCSFRPLCSFFFLSPLSSLSSSLSSSLFSFFSLASFFSCAVSSKLCPSPPLPNIFPSFPITPCCLVAPVTNVVPELAGVDFALLKAEDALVARDDGALIAV